MNKTTTVIIGAGQSGLAMSQQLTQRSIDHVLLERGDIANSWRTERWDSLRLLTPNWQSRLPGFRYDGPDPDGYMDMPEVIRFLDGYGRHVQAPVETHTSVEAVRRTDSGYRVETDRGTWLCRTLVAASGACNIAGVPKIADQVPHGIDCITPMQYRNPGQLADGRVLVVGASATGMQLAREIRQSGRDVILAAGEHVRVPRVYRGRDIKWWMDRCGLLDLRYDEVDDIRRARRVPSLQLAGTHDRADLDINALAETGIEVVGRLAGARDNTLLFSGALGNICALADLKMNRLLDTIDAWIEDNGMTGEVDAKHRFDPTRIAASPRLEIDLASSGIKSIVWATGYRPDHSWLDVPVFDRKGRIVHDGGVTGSPGLYVMGLPFLRRRKSSLIDGAADDARDLADHLQAFLADRSLAA
ncbi:NAD(P)-binding domain-containing protein [Nitratireductor sp. XY-223]|uniref:NAD(P)-binding domain-containing protein n=1 Tax=Nitratireductor sp. XY-223 TaxID=2561926 RepID=UPI0010AA3C32|nr:NAD(P)-binding domain-containing protein [Nitratireductor sp. XY-223]